MKVLIPILFLLSISACSSKNNCELVWHDEFDNDTLNLVIWKYSETKPGKQLSGYCKSVENVYVKDGLLHLRLFKDKTDSVKPYKTGRVISNDAFPIENGKLEIKAKFDVVPGIWPALWLRPLPSNKAKLRGEIDMMEYIDRWHDSLIQVNYHLWGDFRGKVKHHVQYPHKVGCKASDWHVYELTIQEECLSFMLDGSLVYEINKGEKGVEWPFDYPYQLLLAYAYGGWGACDNMSDNNLPVEFLIDYVRFYKIVESD